MEILFVGNDHKIKWTHEALETGLRRTSKTDYFACLVSPYEKGRPYYARVSQEHEDSPQRQRRNQQLDMPQPVGDERTDCAIYGDWQIQQKGQRMMTHLPPETTSGCGA